MDQLKAEREHNNVIVVRLKPSRDALRNRVLYTENKQTKIVWLHEIKEFSQRIENIRQIINDLNYIGIYETADDSVFA